ncbi:MAG: HNH endonuclease [Microbacteriaceae bacterium]|nr:HNH endonuclease [Microbacteriaceae bacterium]
MTHGVAAQQRAGQRGKAEGRGAQGTAAPGHAGGDAVRHGVFGQPNGATERAAGEPHGPDTGPHDPSGEPIDVRSIDEIRADILADLLLTGAPEGHTSGGDDHDMLGGSGGLGALGAIRARVQVTVPVLSLIGRSDVPASLAGVGPIDAGTARELAGGSTGWDRVLTDPIAGSVLAVDRYTPSQQLKRTLRVRDVHCRFPGCRQSVDRSDIDHTIDYAHGGRTTLRNLAHLCRRHHTLKHATAWCVTQRPDGILEWTSPTGRVYPDVPTSTVMFRPVHQRHFSRGDDSNGDAARGDAPRGVGPSVAGVASGVTEDPPPF